MNAPSRDRQALAFARELLDQQTRLAGLGQNLVLVEDRYLAAQTTRMGNDSIESERVSLSCPTLSEVSAIPPVRVVSRSGGRRDGGYFVVGLSRGGGQCRWVRKLTMG